MAQALTILHVEDDPDIREIALIALETLGGLTVIQCASGPEAIERVAEVKPDLFLLDLMMPAMSGEETLKALRAVEGFAATPTIFMTAKAHSADIQRLLDLGAATVITKPFDPMTLADSIRETWNRL